MKWRLTQVSVNKFPVSLPLWCVICTWYCNWCRLMPALMLPTVTASAANCPVHPYTALWTASQEKVVSDSNMVILEVNPKVHYYVHKIWFMFWTKWIQSILYPPMIHWVFYHLVLSFLNQCFSAARPRPGIGTSFYRKKNLLGHGLTKVENRCPKWLHILRFSNRFYILL